MNVLKINDDDDDDDCIVHLCRAVIDLSQLEVEKTYSIEQQLEDGAGVVHLLVSISGQSSLTDLNKPSLKERESIVRKYVSNCAVLFIID